LAQKKFSGRCAVCKSPDRFRIELLKAGGVGLDALAKKFHVSRDSVHRHWALHVPPEVKATYLAGPGDLATFAEKAAQEGDSVLDYLRFCRSILVAQLAAANESGDSRTSAYVADKLRMLLETLAKVTGQLGSLASSITFNTTNVAVLAEHPHFLKMQASILQALGPHPAARADVVRALRSLDAETEPAATHPAAIEHLPPIEDSSSHAA
jgi:hypothetical protein